MCILSFETVSHFVGENKIITSRIEIVWKMNRWKESNWVTYDWDKITRLDFSECTLNNSYCSNNVKNFLSDFIQHNVKTTRWYIWEWTYLYNRSLSNNTYDFTFKEWNWFSYFLNRCLIAEIMELVTHK